MKSAFKHSGNGLVYYWRESIGTALFLTVFAGIWNTVVLGALYATLSGEGFTVDEVPYTSLAEAYVENPVILIFLLFPAIGLVMAYLALCFWLNKTTFSFDGFYLSKKTAPLPMKGDFKISRSSIVKVFTRYAPARNSRNATNNFSVFATMIDGKEQEIFSLGLKADEASVLETWINEKLNF